MHVEARSLAADETQDTPQPEAPKKAEQGGKDIDPREPLDAAQRGKCGRLRASCSRPCDARGAGSRGWAHRSRVEGLRTPPAHAVQVQQRGSMILLEEGPVDLGQSSRVVSL